MREAVRSLVTSWGAVCVMVGLVMGPVVGNIAVFGFGPTVKTKY